MYTRTKFLPAMNGDTGKEYKYYAVSKGGVPSIYDNWVMAEQQVLHFSGNVYKGLKTLEGAEKCMKTARIHSVKYLITNTDSNPVQLPAVAESTKDKNTTENVEWSELEDVSNVDVHSETKTTSTPIRNANTSNSICTKCSILEKQVNSLNSKLEAALDQLKFLSLLNHKLELAVAQIQELESYMGNLKSSQTEAESTIGPQIKGALSRLQNIATQIAPVPNVPQINSSLSWGTITSPPMETQHHNTSPPTPTPNRHITADSRTKNPTNPALNKITSGTLLDSVQNDA